MPGSAHALAQDDAALLAFEAEWREHSGAKEEAIRTAFGLSPARYYRRLGRLIDTEAALAADPLLVGGLRRLRDQRVSERVHVAR